MKLFLCPTYKPEQLNCELCLAEKTEIARHSSYHDRVLWNGPLPPKAYQDRARMQNLTSLLNICFFVTGMSYLASHLTDCLVRYQSGPIWALIYNLFFARFRCVPPVCCALASPRQHNSDVIFDNEWKQLTSEYISQQLTHEYISRYVRGVPDLCVAGKPHCHTVGLSLWSPVSTEEGAICCINGLWCWQFHSFISNISDSFFTCMIYSFLTF